MKVEIKLSTDQLCVVGIALESFTEKYSKSTSALTNRDKSVLSIAMDVTDKIHTKVRRLLRSPKPATHKLVLKYHEAFAVHTFLILKVDIETDTYAKNIFRNVLIKLDQKLA